MIQCADALLHALHVLLKTMPYEDYLQTEWWKGVRRMALRRADNSCQLCNAKNVQLDVHHRTYERRGCERREDVIVLCRECHSKHHGKIPSFAPADQDADRA